MSHLPHYLSNSTAADRRLKVLHVIKGLGPGGAERLIVNQLATSTSNIDYSVAYAVPEKDHLVAEITELGATVTLLDQARLPLSLYRTISAIKPDIVHAHSPLLAVCARIIRATRPSRFAMVTTEHNRWPRHHRLTRAANRLTARIDDARIAVSEDVRSSMSSSIAATTQVLDHGIPLDQVSSAASSRTLQRQQLFGDANDGIVAIGIVANFRPEKDYDTFLAAAERALPQVPHLHLVAVGQGPGEHDFRERASRHERLHVLGYRPDVHHVMSALDAFTLSSRHEGKPVSLMEAFALGLPAIATRAGGIPEVITDGHNGLLVDVGDHEALAQSWVKIANDPVLRQRLAADALESAQRFNAASATRSIEDSYRFLVAGSDHG